MPAKKALKKSITKSVKKSVKKSAKPPITKSSKQLAKEVAAAHVSSPLYEVRRSRIQGRGAFAIKPIRKGQKIDEYIGERITHEEADRRYDDNHGRHHTFLFVLDKNTVLDARFGGCDARFLNHSCDPNCETEISRGHIWIKSIKPIQPETELVYDYRFDWQDEFEPEDIRYYACRCGTKKCRGTILMVPRYLKETAAKWLAGDDVRKPRKPKKKSAKSALDHPHPAERHATKVVKKATKKAAKKGARR